MHGAVVERTDQFAPALSEALSQDTSSLLELRVDPEAITTRASLSAIREKALQQNKGQ